MCKFLSKNIVFGKYRVLLVAGTESTVTKLINVYKKNKVDFRNTMCIIVYMHLNIGQMKVAGKWRESPPKE